VAGGQKKAADSPVVTESAPEELAEVCKTGAEEGGLDAQASHTEAQEKAVDGTTTTLTSPEVAETATILVETAPGIVGAQCPESVSELAEVLDSGVTEAVVPVACPNDVESAVLPAAGVVTTGFASPVGGRAGLATPTAGFTTPAAGGLETTKHEKEGSFLLQSAHPSVGTDTAIVAPQDVQPASENMSALPVATLPTQLLSQDTCGGRPATSTVLLATHRTPHENTARVLPLPSVAPELQTSKDIAKHLMAGAVGGARDVLENKDESGWLGALWEKGLQVAVEVAEKT